MKEELQNEIFKVLRKYGLIIIGYMLWSRFAVAFLDSFFSMMGLFQNTNSYDIDTVISSGVAYIAKLVVWLLMLSDIGQNGKLRWLLLFVTLFNPVMGVTFIVIYKVVSLSKE
jgi:hypothetical protein